MENASKALIIAGAILLAILLISLGIMVYNQASGVVDSTAMDEVAVTSFNKKFTQYEGSNVRGTQVRALFDTVEQNNLSNSGDKSKQVTFSGVTDKTKVQTGKSYSVNCTKDPKSGYVTTITVTLLDK